MISGNRETGLTFVKKVYGFWGEHPGLYAASDYLTFLGRPGAVRGRAARALSGARGGRVLEAGCGTGRNLGHLEKALGPGTRIVGADFSFSMLSAAGDLARDRGWENLSFVNCDAARLPLSDESADGILAVLAVSAFPDWKSALSECRRVLAPGGGLSICDARLFTGPLASLNPLVRAAYRRWAAWDPGRDIPGEMERIFGNVSVDTCNLGTFFHAFSHKEAR